MKKKLIAIIVVGVLLLMIISFVVYKLQDDRITSLYIGTIDENYDGDGISIRAFTDSSGWSSINGKCDYKIRYVDGDTEVLSGRMSIKNDKGNINLPFKDFVAGNGEYEITVQYGDKKDSDVYDIGWVLEAVDVDYNLGDIVRGDNGDLSQGGLTIFVGPLNTGGSFKFEMPASVISDLNNYEVTQNIYDQFKSNSIDLSDPVTGIIGGTVEKIDDDKWVIKYDLNKYFIQEESGTLSVYLLNSGIDERIKDATIDLEIFYEGAKVDSFTKSVSDSSKGGSAFDYESQIYQQYGAGEWRFEVTASNNNVSTDSNFYEGLTTVMKADLNQNVRADLEDFAYDYSTKHFHKSVTISSSEAEDGYTIDFDASSSMNDGVITEYQWDWDYYNDQEEDIEDFDVDDTGETVSHTFYPDLPTLTPKTTVYDIGLKVVGDREVVFYDYLEGEQVTQMEEDSLMIELEITVTVL